jgi:SulP family sulfate permease
MLAYALMGSSPQLVVGLLKVGWVAEFLSKPIVTGFVIGLTVLVIMGEVPKLVGITAPQGATTGYRRCLGTSARSTRPPPRSG